MVPVDYPNSTPVCSLELDWHGKHTRENSEIIRVFNKEMCCLFLLTFVLFFFE